MFIFDWYHLTNMNVIEVSNKYFCSIKISRNGEINERSCSNPHLAIEGPNAFGAIVSSCLSWNIPVSVPKGLNGDIT